MEDLSEKYQALRTAVEQRFGRKLTVRGDFDILSREVSELLSLQLSSTTMRRFWDYQNDQSSCGIRESSLDILARYVGYRSWRQFCNPQLLVDVESSHISVSSRIYIEDLKPGVLIRMNWRPDREVIVRYEGGFMFTVISSKNSKLLPGGVFRCQLMMEGEILSIADLVYPDKSPVCYCCGKGEGGVHYTIISPEED